MAQQHLIKYPGMDTRGFAVPKWMEQFLCQCIDCIPEFNKQKHTSVCKLCGKVFRDSLRSCQGCGQTFIWNFSHPRFCFDNIVCWDCLNDPLCDDLTCSSGHGGNVHQVPIRPPSFIVKEPAPWDGVSVFSFS